MALRLLPSTVSPFLAPACPSLATIKGRGAPPAITTLTPAFLCSLPSPQLPPTKHRPPPPFPSVARPPHRRLSPSEARAKFPVFPSLCCAPAGERLCSRVAGGHAPVRAPLCFGAFTPCHRRSTMDRATRPQSTTCRLGARDYPL
jgi:hypothetical protein